MNNKANANMMEATKAGPIKANDPAHAVQRMT